MLRLQEGEHPPSSPAPWGEIWDQILGPGTRSLCSVLAGTGSLVVGPVWKSHWWRSPQLCQGAARATDPNKGQKSGISVPCSGRRGPGAHLGSLLQTRVAPELRLVPRGAPQPRHHPTGNNPKLDPKSSQGRARSWGGCSCPAGLRKAPSSSGFSGEKPNLER